MTYSNTVQMTHIGDGDDVHIGASDYQELCATVRANGFNETFLFNIHKQT
jgi:hypothetical protein